MVAMELLAPAGAERDPAGAEGLGQLTGELLDEGTRRSTAEEIARTTDRLGESLTTGAGWHVGYASIQVLAQHLDPALELLAEVMTEASFPFEEVERLRREQEAELLQRRDRPGLLALDRLSQVLYSGGRYASPIPGTEASVRDLRREQIVEHYRLLYRPGNLALLAVGDFDPTRLLATAEALLGRGEPSTPPPAPGIQPPAHNEVTVHLVDRPGAAQTELRMGHASLSRLDPDFVPFLVLNVLLGGKFTSRINLNLRERHGYTYGASSRLSIRRGPAPFVISSAVATESTGAAVLEVLREMERLQQEPVDPRELEDGRDYLTGVFPYTLQTLDGVMQRLESMILYDLPDDYYDRYRELLGAVERDTILEVARRHLQPSRMAVVAAGPVDRLRPQFDELALGPISITAVPETAGPSVTARLEEP